MNPAANSQIARLASLLLESAAGDSALELGLREGAEVVVRVVQSPPDGGKGLVTLAGRLLEARVSITSEA